MKALTPFTVVAAVESAAPGPIIVLPLAYVTACPPVMARGPCLP